MAFTTYAATGERLAPSKPMVPGELNSSERSAMQSRSDLNCLPNEDDAGFSLAAGSNLGPVPGAQPGAWLGQRRPPCASHRQHFMAREAGS